MRNLIYLFLLTSSIAYGENYSCQQNALKLAKKSLVSKGLITKAESKKLKFTSFRNTTPGTYWQEYEARAVVAGESFNISFESPFICDDLSIVEVN